MYIKTLTVSALNNYIKKILDNDFILNNTSIKGEISNFKWHSSGHLYFSLKDDFSKINCVMFRSQAEKLLFTPENGMNVVVKGRIAVYEKDGTYQLYCNEMAKEGIGELYLAFQELKNKLEKEGLFEVEHKKPIPKYPRRIGIVTSPTGAAVRDILNVAKRRNNGIDILIYPALVQGTNASGEIIKGIRHLNSIDDIDVIILARGGGSIEELWAFNNEQLAYEIFGSKKPIITGVGHETDFTIADFVSDRRAPTPSAAAEIAVPSLQELNNNILGYRNYLLNSASASLQRRLSRIQLISKSLEINNPINYIVNQYNYIDRLRQSLEHNISHNLAVRRERLSSLYEVLNAQNPLNVLNRGYAVIEDEESKVISSIEKLKAESNIKIIMRDGEIKTTIHPSEEKKS